MSRRTLHRRMIANAAGSRLNILLPLLLFVPAFVGCDNLQQPTDREDGLLAKASVAVDAHTLLFLRFDGNFTGESGEQPIQASGLTFEPGVLGSGVLIEGADRLTYGSADNFKPAAGTIDFWVKPRWAGDDQIHHFFFSLGNQLMLLKDGADNLRFILKVDDSEAYQAYPLGAWRANEWHYLAVTWTVPGVMTTYVDGQQVFSHPSSTQDLITSIPAELSVGRFGSSYGSYPTGSVADAVIDELRISDLARTAEEIASRYACYSSATSPDAAQAAVIELGEQVAGLVSRGELSRAEGHALEVKLTAAARLFAHGHSKAAANVLKAFENQLNALLGSGRLTYAEGQMLLTAVQCLIEVQRR